MLQERRPLTHHPSRLPVARKAEECTLPRLLRCIIQERTSRDSKVPTHHEQRTKPGCHSSVFRLLQPRANAGRHLESLIKRPSLVVLCFYREREPLQQSVTQHQVTRPGNGVASAQRAAVALLSQHSGRFTDVGCNLALESVSLVSTV